MSIEYRPLSAADFPLVIDLATRIWPAAYEGNLTAEQLDNLLSRIYCPANLSEELASGHRFWAAYDGDTALGFASGYKEQQIVWIKKLYVLPEAQGRGIGRGLMQTVIAAFAPIEEVRLFVNGDNAAAIAFYEKCGFVRAATVPVRMGDFDFTDYIYAKPLADCSV